MKAAVGIVSVSLCTLQSGEEQTWTHLLSPFSQLSLELLMAPPPESPEIKATTPGHGAALLPTPLTCSPSACPDLPGKKLWGPRREEQPGHLTETVTADWHEGKGAPVGREAGDSPEPREMPPARVEPRGS